ncbi:hypothetical protein J5N97_018510 [Dioscorea zingiberensis]|uniref:KIB1-4 beta-propeller domain-containing protein n=1 Tax=Dioscorea zingiberensis TaxID=325984 RepID=A0A9D5CC16_9LILI|nr:hypothetical protein J5N97_018510 [Dioscorea zingiberensis]
MELNTEELQKDVREYIISYIKWGPICSSWSAVAKKRHSSSKRFRLPLVVFFNAYKENSTRFFSLSTQNIYRNLNFPELRGCHICGSSHGWLVTVDINLQICLFDPFSQSQIKLPSLPLSDDDRHDLSLRYVNSDLQSTETSEEELRDRLVIKAILTADPRKSSDYMVVSSYGQWEIGIWRSGDASWSPLDGRYSQAAADFILHKEKLYVLINSGHLLSFDLVGPYPKFITIYDFMDLLRYPKYLVDVKGELLIVERDVPYGDDHSQMTTSFRISKFEPETGQIRKLNSIGDNILFLGMSYSMALESDEPSGYEKDNIYFTDDNYPGLQWNGFKDMGIFNIKDGTFKPFLPNDVYNPAKSPQIWLEAHKWLPNPGDDNCS